jgi:hypothetical protein
MALLGARTPLLSLGKRGFHTFSHPYGGCLGKAAVVRNTVVKTRGRQRELNPTPVQPPTVRHLPLEHACSTSVRTQTEVPIMTHHLDLLCESHLDSVDTPPQANDMSDFYHPMRSLNKLVNFDVTSGFLNMSDMFNDVCIFLIFMLPFWISSRKWCHLIDMCFVLGLFCKGSLAKCMHPWFSSQSIDDSSLYSLFEW